MSTYTTSRGTLRTETVRVDTEHGAELVTRWFIDGREVAADDVQEFWNCVRGIPFNLRDVMRP